MIKRFCLYGFLKNSDFSKPFIVLFYISLGLNFFQIGVLTAFLNILINLMEIPSGSFADLYGRKTTMIVSLISYVLAFLLFSIAQSFALLFPALFFYAIGDAFRTGTHKAIIFDWLKMNNRLEEKTKVYGYTRSWSNYGSAVSVIISAIIIVMTQNYRFVFILSTIPALLGVWNMLCYPNELNHRKERNGLSVKEVLHHTLTTIKKSFQNKEITKLIIQNMSFLGCFSISKDYLQPLLKLQAGVLAGYFIFSEKKSTAILIGIIYCILHIMSARTSRNAHKFLAVCKSEKKSSIILLFAGFILLCLAGIGFLTKVFVITIIAYILLFILQNLWVPINVTQYDNYSDETDQATILSIASQAKTLGIAIFAPVTGFLADHAGIHSALFFLAGILLLTTAYSKYEKKT